MAGNNLFYISHKDFIAIAEELSNSGNPFSFRATGTSMSPFIKSGDTITIMPGPVPMNIGDVALVKTDRGKLLLHRIIKKQEKGVVTRGDAVMTDDGFIPIQNVIGKVIKVSGEGYNFHLRKPYKYLIGKGTIFRKSIYNRPFAVRFLKNLANILG